MTINHWIFANICYFSHFLVDQLNSVQNFSHVLLRLVRWAQEEKAARSLEDTWRRVISDFDFLKGWGCLKVGDVLGDGVGKPC